MGQKNELKSLDRYSSPPQIKNPDEKLRTLYYTIYNDYISLNMTNAQLGEKYDYHPRHIQKIIKWVAFDIGEFDADAQLQALIDKILLRQQSLEYDLQSNEKMRVRDKVSLYAELRKHDMFLAKLQGLITNSLIDASDRSRNITVITNPNLKRGHSDGEEDTTEIDPIEVSEFD